MDWIARTHGYERFISAQNHYNLLEREAEIELMPACDRFGVGLLPYFPLASGILTGKYQRGQPAPQGSRWSDRPIPDRTYDLVEKLAVFGAERGRSLLEVAIAGLAAQKSVSSIIAGATRPSQMKANAEAIEWTLDVSDCKALREILDTAPPAHLY